MSHSMKSSHFACADGLTPRKHTVCLGTALCLHCQILSHCECSAVVYSNKNEKSKKKKSTPASRQRGRVESERLAETWTFSKSQKVASPRRLTPLGKVEKSKKWSHGQKVQKSSQGEKVKKSRLRRLTPLEKVEKSKKSKLAASPKTNPCQKVEKVEPGRAPPLDFWTFSEISSK